MIKKRPTGVLVIAILHLVGGGLGLILVLCAGIGLAMQSSMTKALATANPEDPSIRVQAQMEQKLPSAKAVQVGQMIVSLVLSGMLIAAGIGLLSMRNWARILSFVYAGLSIIEKLVFLGFFLLVTWPVMSVIIDLEYNKPAKVPVPGGAGTMKAFTIGGVVVNELFIIYPIVVLFVLLMPSVRVVFAEKPRGSRDNDDTDEDDYDDDDRPRRRSSRRDEDDDEDDDDRGGDRGSGRYRS